MPLPVSEKRFLQFGAVCSAALALTTFLLWLLPQYVGPADTFERRLSLAHDPYNLARLWVTFVHMFLGLAAYYATYRVLREKAPGFAGLGLLCFVVWALIELLAVSFNLFAVNGTWRAGYAAANADTQALYRSYLGAWAGVWEALYFLLAFAYLLGSLFLGGVALADRQNRATRGVGALILMGGAISAAFLISGYGGSAWPGEIAGAVYPVFQPAARALMAVWLFRSALH